MYKLKKVLLMGTAYVLVAALAIGGTLAYLTSKDSDVNVMTMGNVKIEQIEQQYDENGNLVDFEQDKPLYPYVGELGWKNTDKNNGAYRQFTMNNVVDKYVSVKNIGKNDAYVRTFIALEMGGFTYDEFTMVGISVNLENGSEFKFPGAWNIASDFVEVIDGCTYNVMEFVHSAPLKPGETTVPSLLQVYLSKDATNEDVEKLDGNGNGKYDIIVISQAVQTAGFENANAKYALDAAFGAPNDKSAETGVSLCAEWLGTAVDNYEAEQEAKLVDTWDGTVDTTWYNDIDTTFTITTAEQLAGLSKLVDEGNTFEGKIIKLGKHIDLYVDGNGEPVSFDPIGSYAFDKPFKGTFDGQGKTISNMYQSGWALGNGLWDGDDCGLGLFGLVEDATITGLNLDSSNLPSECNLIGFVAGAAYGECVFEDIAVTNSYSGNHSYYSGGIVGWASGKHKYINCDLDASNFISSQWGDFNNALGGIIGGAGKSGTYYFEDCDVACVLDAYNDVTSAYEWYSYRNCGMLIGNTGRTTEIDGRTYADASNVTCKNVTVTYGEWANYHYCEFGSSNYPFCRVEAGKSTGAYGNARVGEYYDANGNLVVDDSHVHNDGEKHNELIELDQLFGGPSGDRYNTYGTNTHDGVKVIYNNK